METHTKIINDTAKKILKPQGLFRVGSSRRWLEDNGYYFTIVDFEPSGYVKGSYLNVGVNFLWGSTEEDNASLTYCIGGRVAAGNGAQFAEYRQELKNCDNIFEKNITELADAALSKVIEYRKYRDPGHIKDVLIKRVNDIHLNSQYWELYNLAMICFFKGDHMEGRCYLHDFLDLSKKSFYQTVVVIQGGKKTVRTVHTEWIELFYNYCINTIVPKIGDPQSAQQMVYDMIDKRRAVFSAKASYKGMKKDIWYISELFFGEPDISCFGVIVFFTVSKRHFKTPPSLHSLMIHLQMLCRDGLLWSEYKR